MFFWDYTRIYKGCLGIILEYMYIYIYRERERLYGDMSGHMGLYGRCVGLYKGYTGLYQDITPKNAHPFCSTAALPPSPDEMGNVQLDVAEYDKPWHLWLRLRV